MTPDQIFKAESKLRELGKLRSALSIFPSFVFSGEVDPVPGATGGLNFPLGKSDLAKLLRDAAKDYLVERADALEYECIKDGVIFAEPST